MDRITNYYCCSVGNMTFLVCYNTTFNLTPPSTVDHYTIPKYSYCHKVTIDTNKKKGYCSCNERKSHGRPCIHMMKVLNNHLHGSMFHPRYFKITNSPLFHVSLEVRSLYDQMVQNYRKDANSVPLDYVWDDLKFCCDNEDGLCEGTTLDHKVRMIFLRRWNEAKKPFDRYCMRDTSLNVLNEHLDPDADIGLYVDFNLPLNQEHSEDFVPGDDPDGIENEGSGTFDHRYWYNQVLAEIHDLSKLCETRPASMEHVLLSIRTLKHELHSKIHTELMNSGVVTDESNAGMVSANMTSELSPLRKRWKSGYEGS